MANSLDIVLGMSVDHGNIFQMEEEQYLDPTCDMTPITMVFNDSLISTGSQPAQRPSTPATRPQLSRRDSALQQANTVGDYRIVPQSPTTHLKVLRGCPEFRTRADQPLTFSPALGNASDTYTRHIERLFRTRCLHTLSTIRQYERRSNLTNQSQLKLAGGKARAMRKKYMDWVINAEPVDRETLKIQEEERVWTTLASPDEAIWLGQDIQEEMKRRGSGIEMNKEILKGLSKMAKKESSECPFFSVDYDSSPSDEEDEEKIVDTDVEMGGTQTFTAGQPIPGNDSDSDSDDDEDGAHLYDDVPPPSTTATSPVGSIGGNSISPLTFAMKLNKLAKLVQDLAAEEKNWEERMDYEDDITDEYRENHNIFIKNLNSEIQILRTELERMELAGPAYPPFDDDMMDDIHFSPSISLAAPTIEELTARLNTYKTDLAESVKEAKREYLRTSPITLRYIEKQEESFPSYSSTPISFRESDEGKIFTCLLGILSDLDTDYFQVLGHLDGFKWEFSKEGRKVVFEGRAEEILRERGEVVQGVLRRLGRDEIFRDLKGILEEGSVKGESQRNRLESRKKERIAEVLVEELKGWLAWMV